MMDKYFPQDTREALANAQVDESRWDDQPDQSAIETLIGLSASYRALARYVSGADLYMIPRNASDLLSLLTSYSRDAIHTTISQMRTEIQPGGYGRVCDIARVSLRNAVNADDNTSLLLALHRPAMHSSPIIAGSANNPRDRFEHSPPRRIKTM